MILGFVCDLTRPIDYLPKIRKYRFGCWKEIEFRWLIFSLDFETGLGLDL